jgi:two-component system chemotaxis response regulator CheY
MAKWRVMTVDDSAAMLTIIASYLEGSEFEVVASERDGVMAVERFAQERPDIVLLDLIMPGQSGVETLERILAIDPDAFVVIMSSRRTERAVQECLRTGARSFLQKPFAQGDLVDFMLDLALVA